MTHDTRPPMSAREALHKIVLLLEQREGLRDRLDLVTADERRRFRAAALAEDQHYSVLLLYPDYLSSEPETFYTTVRAETSAQAIARARWEAAEANRDGDDVPDPVDWAVLGIWRGRQQMLYGLTDGV